MVSVAVVGSKKTDRLIVCFTYNPMVSRHKEQRLMATPFDPLISEFETAEDEASYTEWLRTMGGMGDMKG